MSITFEADGRVELPYLEVVRAEIDAVDRGLVYYLGSFSLENTYVMDIPIASSSPFCMLLERRFGLTDTVGYLKLVTGDTVVQNGRFDQVMTNVLDYAREEFPGLKTEFLEGFWTVIHNESILRQSQLKLEIEQDVSGALMHLGPIEKVV